MKLPKYSKIPRRIKAPLLVRRVAGHSMMPTLPPGTTVWAVRWFRGLKSGDVVVFLHDKKEKIKRIDRIELDGRLHVLGDYPATSTDSRHFGAIHPDLVIAKVLRPSTKQ